MDQRHNRYIARGISIVRYIESTTGPSMQLCVFSHVSASEGIPLIVRFGGLSLAHVHAVCGFAWTALKVAPSEGWCDVQGARRFPTRPDCTRARADVHSPSR
jgi:hypothetical protein